LPKGQAQGHADAVTIGGGGPRVLAGLSGGAAPAWLRQLAAVATLRQGWVQQYDLSSAAVPWGTAEEPGLPPWALGLRSPHDSQARYWDKGGSAWGGYKAQVTETCAAGTPRVIRQVATTLATVPDQAGLEGVHQELAATALLPGRHLVDSGYVHAALLGGSQHDQGVELCGPARPDTAWQAQAAQGFAATAFTLDWGHQRAQCPGGPQRSSWPQSLDRYGKARLRSKFAVRDCRPCGHRADCTRIARRILTLGPRGEFLAQAQARPRERTAEYTALYAQRAGVGGSLSQAVRRCGLRRARDVGLAKTHLQNVLAAAALHLVRLSNWLAEAPRAKTRRPSFASLRQGEPVPC